MPPKSKAKPKAPAKKAAAGNKVAPAAKGKKAKTIARRKRNESDDDDSDDATSSEEQETTMLSSSSDQEEESETTIAPPVPAKKVSAKKAPAKAAAQQRPSLIDDDEPQQQPLAQKSSTVVRSLLETFSTITVSSDASKKNDNGENESVATGKKPTGKVGATAVSSTAALIDATASLIHAMFLIGQTNAVQAAPRVRVLPSAAANNNNNNYYNIVQQNQQQPSSLVVTLSQPSTPNGKYILRPVAAAAGPLVADMLFANGSSPLGRDRLAAVHQLQHVVSPQRGNQLEDASAGALPPSAAKAVRLSLRPSIVAAIQAVVPAQIVDIHVLRRVAACTALPPSLCIMHTSFDPHSNSSSTNHGHSHSSSVPSSGGRLAAAAARTNAVAAAASSYSGGHVSHGGGGNAAAAAAAALGNVILLRSPLEDGNVPSEAQIRDLMKDRGFSAADARSIWYGTVPSALPAFATTPAAAAAAANKTAVSTDAAAATGKKPSPKKKKQELAGTRRKRNESDEDGERERDEVSEQQQKQQAALLVQKQLPADLLRFLSADKRNDVVNHAVSEAAHVKANTDARIRERRELEALVTTLNVARSSVGGAAAESQETGVVSVLRAVSRALVQSGFTASSSSSASEQLNRDNAELIGRPKESDGLLTVVSLTQHQNPSSSSSSALAHVGSTASGSVSIFQDAVNQIRLLLKADKAAVYYRPMMMPAVEGEFESGIETNNNNKNKNNKPCEDAAGELSSSPMAMRDESVRDFEAELQRCHGKPELLNGVLFVPKTAAEVARRSTFINEIANKIAALLFDR